MDLSKIAIEPRIRNGWQALDLGFVMARQWYWPLFLVWSIPAFCLLLVLSVVCYKISWLPFLIIWWLKPLWDRLPLVYASRALFGESPRVRQSINQCFKAFKTDWFASITWRRFSPSRSFDMPTSVLEGLRGAERTRRLSVLHQTSGNAALWLTMVCFHIENFLIFGLWGFVILMVPEEFQVNWFEIIGSGSWGYAQLSGLLAFIGMALIGPFYSLAGFGLYISRRIELEGWDIEIRFRHLVEQHNARQDKKLSSPKAQPKSTAVGKNTSLLSGFTLALLIGLGGTTLAPDSMAQESTDAEIEAEKAFVSDYYQRLEQSVPASHAKQEIVEILEGDDFHRTELETGRRFKPSEKDEEDEEDPDLDFSGLDSFFESLSDLLGGFAIILEVVIWGLIIALVVYIVYRYHEGFLSMFGGRRSKIKDTEKPEVLFGLDVRKESLPDDVPAQVLALWQQGEQREAISLLYRATFSHLIHRYGFEFYDGYTEQECVDIVSASADRGLTDYVSRLTRVWQMLAYAHREPATEQVSALCREWPPLFEQSTGGQHAK